ncbi:MAG TPA: holo-[acyl-carrier-protein] synthase [Ruminiclostridium sp.]|nr:holo-[acyl-carrier-protein] synthase [Ruminiclostridium sp.]
MRIRCGMDLIELKRIENALSSHGESFKKRVYTARERAYCDGRGEASVQSYAARFCGKEAVAKALGTGIAKGVCLQDIEITVDGRGRPCITLHNEARRIYEAMGGKSMDISLTHSHDYAAAQAVLLTDEE